MPADTQQTTAKYRVNPEQPCSVQEHFPREAWQPWQLKASFGSQEEAQWYVALLTGQRICLPCCPTCGGPAPVGAMRHAP